MKVEGSKAEDRGQQGEAEILPSPSLSVPSAAASAAPSSRAFISALGLDIGSKRIGIAGCDGTGLIASGIATMERSAFDRDVAQFRALVQERKVQVLVVGLPYAMNGTLGFQAKQIKKYTQRLSAALGLPVEYIDERLTSFQAEELLKDAKISPSRNKALIDRKAASLILQQWLDQRRQEKR